MSGCAGFHSRTAGADAMIGDRRTIMSMGTGRVLAMGLALSLISSLLAATPGDAADLDAGCPAELMATGSFEDVESDSTHATAIECLAFHRVTEGVTEGHYGPDRAVTRQQMATFLARVVDGSEATLPSANVSFDDVDAGSVHAEAVERLATAGIAQGRGDGTFGPDGRVTRAQMASFLRRTYEYVARSTLDDDPSHFEDIAGSVHEDNINAVAEAGFARGIGDGRYAPDRIVNRDQMGSFLARVIDQFAAEDRFEVQAPAAVDPDQPLPSECDGYGPPFVEGAETDPEHVAICLYAAALRGDRGAAERFAEGPAAVNTVSDAAGQASWTFLHCDADPDFPHRTWAGLHCTFAESGGDRVMYFTFVAYDDGVLVDGVHLDVD